jgi:hypothetical protein
MDTDRCNSCFVKAPHSSSSRNYWSRSKLIPEDHWSIRRGKRVRKGERERRERGLFDCMFLFHQLSTASIFCSLSDRGNPLNQHLPLVVTEWHSEYRLRWSNLLIKFLSAVCYIVLLSCTYGLKFFSFRPRTFRFNRHNIYDLMLCMFHVLQVIRNFEIIIANTHTHTYIYIHIKIVYINSELINILVRHANIFRDV